MDKEVYNNLLKLKNYDKDVSDFGIYFVIDDQITMKDVELIPNGSCVEVNNQNKISYLYYFAHHKMNVSVKYQLKNFMRGFHRVINPKLLSIFSEEEVGTIINGTEKSVDVVDLFNHVKFVTNNISYEFKQNLFDVVSSFTQAQKKLFLKFITSYNNPPLFGFETLNPSIKIGIYIK